MSARPHTMRLLAPIICLLLMHLCGCIGPEEALAPQEALALASTRINVVLERSRGLLDASVDPAPYAARPGEPGELSFWFHSHPLMGALLAKPDLLEDFNGKHVFKLRPQYIGDWPVAVQKLAVSLAANDLPDLALVKGEWVGRLAAAGRIYPLDEVLPEKLFADFRPQAREAYAYRGHCYGLPVDGFTSLLFVNRGLAGEALPATWDELRNCALRVKASGRLKYPIGHLPFIELLWSAGGRVCNEKEATINSAQALETLRFLLGLRDDGLFRARHLLDEQAGMDAFLYGNAAMTVASSQFLPACEGRDFDIAVAPVPGKEGSVSRLSGAALVAFRHEGPERNAALVQSIKFLTGSALQAEALARGSAQIRRSLVVSGVDGEGVEAAYRCARSVPLTPAWSAVEDELWRCLERAYRWIPAAS